MKAAFVNQFRQQLGTEVEVVRHKFNISGLGGSGGGTSGRAINGILSGQAGFISLVGLWLFSVQ